MKQLIEISVRHIKVGDLIFDYKHRDLQKVEYVSFENEKGQDIELSVDMKLHNVHVSYGNEAMSADNFTANAKVKILVDTESLEIVDPENIGYR